MLPEIKTAWTTALRKKADEVGFFKQGMNLLRNDRNEYCCLGVLCELVKDRYKGSWVKNDIQQLYNFKTDLESRSACLPTAMYNMFPDTCIISDLVNMNDTGVKFDVIADFIDSNL